MSNLNRINFQLQHGYVPKELNYTNYYHSPEYFATKYANCMNIPCFEAVVEVLAEQSKKEGKTPFDKILERQNKISETNIIEDGKLPGSTMCKKC
jgi:hypothetical protein